MSRPDRPDRLAALRKLPDEVFIGLLLIWTAALLQGTLSQVTALTDLPFPGFDKLLHAVGWFGLAWLAGALTNTVPGRIVVWFSCTALGFFVEVGQIAIPMRYFEEWDLVANAVGAAGGVVLALDR